MSEYYKSLISDEEVINALIKESKNRNGILGNESTRVRPNLNFFQRTVNNLVSTNKRINLKQESFRQESSKKYPPVRKKLENKRKSKIWLDKVNYIKSYINKNDNSTNEEKTSRKRKQSDSSISECQSDSSSSASSSSSCSSSSYTSETSSDTKKKKRKRGKLSKNKLASETSPDSIISISSSESSSVEIVETKPKQTKKKRKDI